MEQLVPLVSPPSASNAVRRPGRRRRSATRPTTPTKDARPPDSKPAGQRLRNNGRPTREGRRTHNPTDTPLDRSHTCIRDAVAQCPDVRTSRDGGHRRAVDAPPTPVACSLMTLRSAAGTSLNSSGARVLGAGRRRCLVGPSRQSQSEGVPPLRAFDAADELPLALGHLEHAVAPADAHERLGTRGHRQSGLNREHPVPAAFE